MAVVVVLGAGGVLGSRVAESVAADGHDVLPVLDRASLVTVEGRHRPGASQAVVVDASAAEGDERRATARQAAELGWDLVDPTADPAHLRWLVEDHEVLARSAGVCLVAGAGPVGLIGDLLADAAARALPTASEVHVTYALPDGRGLVGAATPGLRRELLRWLAHGGSWLRDGERIEERVAEGRRLAWFPRPVGPAHAATLPGPESWTVPLHVGGIGSVRTYVAVPGWRAELLQFVANLARWGPTSDAIARRIAGPRGEPGPTVRSTTRWACVVEVAVGEASREGGSIGGDGLARAWAYGRDPLGTAVEGIALLVELLAGAARRDVPGVRGVVGGSQVAGCEAVLDGLSLRTDLRWSLVRPASPAG